MRELFEIISDKSSPESTFAGAILLELAVGFVAIVGYAAFAILRWIFVKAKGKE